MSSLFTSPSLGSAITALVTLGGAYKRGGGALLVLLRINITESTIFTIRPE